ncbi:MAG: hypothetical protein Q9M30_00650 [Mariprofundaceae bacterium]|nr:hypothetical protein [Mariprofundaceae bacterium]
MSVLLIHDSEQQGAPDARMLLKQALPVLWDRLVPLGARKRADALKSNSRLVARIVPGRDETMVEFNGERVFDALRKARVPAIVTLPRFHLLLSVRNEADVEMPQTRSLLEEEAARLAPLQGIELSDSGSGLVLQWRWLDARHVQLSARGQSRLGEFVESREINDADALPLLQQWLGEVLLRARDAYAYDGGAAPGSDGVSGLADAQQGGAFRIELSVERNSNLLAQVALEESLAHDPRVQRILPVVLSENLQRYTLQLEGGDTTWLGEWFARRGYALQQSADGGWVVR